MITRFTDKVAKEICARLAEGESLRRICRDPKMPGKRTVMDWLARGEKSEEPFAVFLRAYNRARELGVEELFEQMQEIADDGENDTYTDDNGRVRTDYDVVARSKLRVDTLKWRLARMSPKKYGDRYHTEVSGPEGGPVMIVTGVPRAGD